MDKAKEKQLQDEFAPWFENLYGDPSKTCLAWGLCVSDGWFPLIYDLCKNIKPLVGPDFRVEQVKEKFGGLRFYCTGGSKEAYELISKAEDDSYTICEQCGTKDDVTVEGGWILTLCKSCRTDRNKK